ncbi:hypothetical protein SEA_SHROOMBOI_79 [Mycobacterium phage ShroomBoi]|uniref:Uncharacterized protein n=3 Tax=Cheoctovirus TaxID=1623281 RepID=A0A2Z5H574_9CAUD|nr:hypothetical protein AVT13_gp081 [Mycobacterium phage Bipolar]YP_009956320.1 hypothetical protein I5H30_gp082 [Mycobacterium phage DRBy19]YP_009960865.1 hypothetical protein I5H74_gp078 [Mycobacterium phage OlympiaSaint]YP_009960974.1 hypothetical protein I5H75_gp080 [Mycobacterium phage OwlsT2W]AXC35613.1 hypothetical protein SEA_CLIFTON_71 [Mycobacterium phage Clifton]QBI98933.1 hypothetical protein SEA_JAMES_79 [Mycobacterium phage James]UVK58544.1 hypothetical protein SEA_JARCOB_78 [My
MSKFKVGDTVIVEASYNESRYGEKTWEDKVAKVGRKYLYLHGDGRTAFDVETGVQKTEYSGSARKVWAPEDWHAAQHRKVVAQAILDHGIRPDGFGDFKQSTTVLERVLDVLEKGDE